jgi:hypothetical protein
MFSGFIYVIVCNETLKLYVGQHRGISSLARYLSNKISTAKYHQRGGTYLEKAMRKYPREAWSIWPLVSEIKTQKELDETERYYIRVLSARNHAVGYNITEGGDGFRSRHTAAARKKMSLIQAARLEAHPEIREAVSVQFKTLWSDPQYSEKMRQIRKTEVNPGRFQKGHVPLPGSPGTEGNPGFWTGKKLSNSHRKTLSDAQTRRWAQDKSRVRPVICVSTGERFASVCAAARTHKTWTSAIRRAIATNTKAGGRRWAYAEQV